MTQETNEQPPVSPAPAEPLPSAIPTPAPDWQKEAQRIQREKDGLFGSFKTVKQERDAFKSQLDELSKSSEGVNASLQIEKDALAQKNQELEAERVRLLAEKGKSEGELEILRTITADPALQDLAPFYAKGLLPVGDLRGDDLKTFLTNYKAELQSLGVNLVKDRNQGSTPAPPGQSQIPALSFFEVQDKKNEALHRYGPQSKEFQQYADLEAKMISGKQHRAAPIP